MVWPHQRSAGCIVEATDVSGALHQASECVALGRWLFILRSAVENPALTWPRRFVSRERVVVVEQVEDILGAGAVTPVYDARPGGPDDARPI